MMKIQKIKRKQNKNQNQHIKHYKQNKYKEITKKDKIASKKVKKESKYSIIGPK